jgi:biopolymer transport protein ExbD
MAELNPQEGRARKGSRRRAKKLSTRVDFTPLVDLGFLLITFFFVTTTWSKPYATFLALPADGPVTLTARDATLTVVAGAGNKVLYYNGNLEDAEKERSFGITGYSMNAGIGTIIREKQLAMDRSYKGGRKEMMLIIKGSPASRYKNVVNLLDETAINQVGRYALIDVTAAETTLLKKKGL